MRCIRIGTRRSKLALAQAGIFKKKALEIFPDIRFETVEIVTKGDRIKSARFGDDFYKGFYTRDLEDALLKNQIDIAIHSLKDLPIECSGQLTLSCFLERGPTNDLLITYRNELDTEPLSVGTSSLRRIYFLSQSYPNLKPKPIKGNIDTRIRKLTDGEYDSICLAEAGIERLKPDMEGAKTIRLSHEQLPPAPCQGIIAAQSRKEEEITTLLNKLSDNKSAIEAGLEREFLKSTGADCNWPLAAKADASKDKVTFSYWVKGKDGPVTDKIAGSADFVLEKIRKIGPKLIIAHKS